MRQLRAIRRLYIFSFVKNHAPHSPRFKQLAEISHRCGSAGKFHASVRAQRDVVISRRICAFSASGFLAKFRTYLENPLYSQWRQQEGEEGGREGEIFTRFTFAYENSRCVREVTYMKRLKILFGQKSHCL